MPKKKPGVIQQIKLHAERAKREFLSGPPPKPGERNHLILEWYHKLDKELQQIAATAPATDDGSASSFAAEEAIDAMDSVENTLAGRRRRAIGETSRVQVVRVIRSDGDHKKCPNGGHKLLRTGCHRVLGGVEAWDPAFRGYEPPYKLPSESTRYNWLANERARLKKPDWIPRHFCEILLLADRYQRGGLPSKPVHEKSKGV